MTNMTDPLAREYINVFWDLLADDAPKSAIVVIGERAANMTRELVESQTTPLKDALNAAGERINALEEAGEEYLEKLQADQYENWDSVPDDSYEDGYRNGYVSGKITRLHEFGELRKLLNVDARVAAKQRAAEADLLPTEGQEARDGLKADPTDVKLFENGDEF